MSELSSSEFALDTENLAADSFQVDFAADWASLEPGASRELLLDIQFGEQWQSLLRSSLGAMPCRLMHP
jgi:hypothetical protein